MQTDLMKEVESSVRKVGTSMVDSGTPEHEFYLRIEPSRGWVSLKLRELWQYRELLYFLTWRDIKVRYKQTVLGAAWAIIQPLMTMIVFSLFFGRLAQVPSDGIPYPIFTTTMTFAATAEVVRYFNAKVVLVDIDPHTFNIDPTQIEAAVTSRTRAIIPVHVAGQAVDLNAIHSIASQHGLTVIEDAAHALPTLYKGRMIGGLSDFTAFSFYATKTLATGEGGMITTNNDEWAERCRIMSLHGISKDAWKRYTSEGNWYYEIVAPGFKYNLTDVASALGLVQLSKLDQMNDRRQTIAARYDVAFGNHPAFEPPYRSADSTHPFHLYIIRLNLNVLQINRNAFINKLRAANIGVSVHWIPLHLHPYYRETYGYQPNDYPVAFREYQRIISLPIYSAMSDEDVDDVINAVIRIATQFGA